MAVLKKLISSVLFFSMMSSFVSCDEIMGTGDDEPIQCDYSIALKGKW